MPALTEILARYDAILCDLWGVIHDGATLYPGVAETLAWLHAQGKPVLFLSNAPRLSAKAEIVLGRLGIARNHYVGVVTSGQVAHDLLADGTLTFPRRGESTSIAYYYLGPGKDEDILDDLPQFTPVTDPAAADFILNTGYVYDFQPHAEILPLLHALHAQRLPLLCVNPDLEVVKIDGTPMLCAGTLAQAYAALGGAVTYIGKPHPAVYARCRDRLQGDNILAVGDNPLTDIRGAQAAGLDSLLITGGILALRGAGAEADSAATYQLPGFGLIA